MKYILVMVITRTNAVFIEKQEFFNKESAEQASDKFISGLKGNAVGGFSRVFLEEQFSAHSLYVELLKANPLASPRELWDRAQEAYKVAYGTSEADSSNCG